MGKIEAAGEDLFSRSLMSLDMSEALKRTRQPSPGLIPFVRTPENSQTQTELQQESLRLHTDENQIVE
jgi:hypothetical protein